MVLSQQQTPSSHVKILLQHRQSKFFFRRTCVWTSNCEAAFDFERTSLAIEFARSHDLTQVQLMVKFVDPECDQVFAIPELVREIRQLDLFSNYEDEAARFFA